MSSNDSATARTVPRTAKSNLALLLLGFLVVFLVGIAAAAVIGWLGITSFFQTKTVDRSQPALLVSTQELSRYTAAVGNFEVLIDTEDDVPWVPSFVAGERSLFVAAGTVNAYVDFSGLSEGDLTLSGDGTSVEVRLPDAELEQPNLDQDRTYLYSQERGIVNRTGDALSSQDQSELYQLAEAKLAAAAAESQLRQQAEDNTKTMLSGMFQSLDLETTFVED